MWDIGLSQFTRLIPSPVRKYLNIFPILQFIPFSFFLYLSIIFNTIQWNEMEWNGIEVFFCTVFELIEIMQNSLVLA